MKNTAKRRPAWLKKWKTAPKGLVSTGLNAPTPTPPPQLGDSFCNISCGKCGHSADYERFHRNSDRNKAGAMSEFQCPDCGHRWRVESGKIEQRIPLLGGGAYVVRAKHIVTVERRQIVVPAERMQSDLWGLPKGDIRAACTADQTTKIRKPFEHEGQLWANWGGSETDCHSTPLLPLAPDRSTILPERDTYSREGAIVVWKGAQYVCGPEVDFIAAPRPPGQVIVLTRRMFAYGGYFATKADGTYRGMLREWMAGDRHSAPERAIYAIEAAADLPQTQEGMRALIGSPSVRTEPRRFNPLTGKTN